jgi:hypothetical protein
VHGNRKEVIIMNYTAAYNMIDNEAAKLTALSDKIWEYPETAYNEVKACEWIAEALKEYGFEVETGLYGMPTSIRNFYHQGTLVRNQQNYQEKYTGVIDRPVEQSIVEFAPGAMKTKDGGEYTCAGLTIPLGFSNECKNQNDYNSKKHELDPLEHIYSLTLNSNGEVLDIQKDYLRTKN